MRRTGCRKKTSAGLRGAVIEVRRAYDLTIDRREANALDVILETCPESSPDTLPACPNFSNKNKP